MEGDIELFLSLRKFDCESKSIHPCPFIQMFSVTNNVTSHNSCGIITTVLLVANIYLHSSEKSSKLIKHSRSFHPNPLIQDLYFTISRIMNP